MTPPDPLPVMPDGVKNLPADLQDDWRYFTQLQSTAPRPLADGEVEKISYISNPKFFQQLAADFLQNQRRENSWSDELRRHGYGHWCGTTAGGYDSCASYLKIMALLADGDRAGALSAAFDISDSNEEYQRGVCDAVMNLSAQGGLDWRRLAPGCLINAEIFCPHRLQSR